MPLPVTVPNRNAGSGKCHPATAILPAKIKDDTPALPACLKYGAGAVRLSSSVVRAAWGVLPVLIVMTVLSLAARLAGWLRAEGEACVSIFIIVMLPIGILTSHVLWKKEQVKVVDKSKSKQSGLDM